MSQFQQPGPEQVPGAPQHPYQPEGRMPPQRPKRKIRWVAPVVTGIACLIIGIVIGGAGESGTTGSPVATATVTAKAKPGSTVTVTAKPQPAPTVTVTAPAPTSKATNGGSDADISDGTYLVGKEIQPGTWRTKQGAEDFGGLCYADTESANGDILAQEVSNSGHTIIKISKGAETFKSSRCGPWERVK